jgi:pimeloyl-ACP methyl ester carboxylesterase
MLIPGFLAGDGSMSVMTRWLRRAGYETEKSGMRANVDCSEAVVARLRERLERLVGRAGRPAAIVGHSRGGSLARVLAVRHRDLVSGIVTLASPVLAPLAVHPLLRVQVSAVSALGSLGAPGFFGRDCLRVIAARTFVPMQPRGSPKRSDSSRSTRVATASSTGVRVSIPRPSTSRRGRAISACRSTPRHSQPLQRPSRR